MAPSAHHAHPSEPARWTRYGPAVAAAAWVAQGLLGAVIASLTCDFTPANGSPATGERATILLLSLVALAVAVAVLLLSWRAWRGLTAERRLVQAEGRTRPEFLALLGMVAGALLGLGILWGALPSLLISQCQVVR